MQCKSLCAARAKLRAANSDKRLSIFRGPDSFVIPTK
jgi:hypothetical protein